jgi:hypothetical protein
VTVRRIIRFMVTYVLGGYLLMIPVAALIAALETHEPGGLVSCFPDPTAFWLTGLVLPGALAAAMHYQRPQFVVAAGVAVPTLIILGWYLVHFAAGWHYAEEALGARQAVGGLVNDALWWGSRMGVTIVCGAAVCTTQAWLELRNSPAAARAVGST